MRSLFYLPLFIVIALSGCAQSSPNKKANYTKRVGGGCERCEDPGTYSCNNKGA